MFCGYPTETHQGILEVVEERAPFSVPSLIWIGEQDGVIPPGLTRETIPFFVSPTVVTSPRGGHDVPQNTDATFSQVVSFVSNVGGGGEVGNPTTNPEVPGDNDGDPMDKPTGEEKPSGDKPIDEEKPNEDDKVSRFCSWVERKASKRCFRTWGGKQLSLYCPDACESFRSLNWEDRRRLRTRLP